MDCSIPLVNIEEKIAELDNLAYVNKTEVVVNGTAFVKGSVYGGSENGGEQFPDETT